LLKSWMMCSRLAYWRCLRMDAELQVDHLHLCFAAKAIWSVLNDLQDSLAHRQHPLKLAALQLKHLLVL
jgi:hypothetical protein